MTGIENSDRRRWLRVGAVSAGLAAVPSVLQAQAETRPRYGIEGRPAPELAVEGWTDRDGEPTRFSLQAARGKWVFLKCFQYWCPGCHSSGFPTLQAVQAAFGEHPGMAIAAVQTVFEGYGTNTEARIAQLRDRYELTIPMAHDPGDPDKHEPSYIMRHYRTGGTPWLILVDPGGTVVYNGFHVDRDKLVEFLDSQLA